MAHQNQIRMKMEKTHLVIGLVGGPMLLGHAVCGDHHAGAIIAEVAMHKDFIFGMVSAQLEKLGNLIVAGSQVSARGDRHVAHSQRFNGALLRRLWATVTKIDYDGDAQILQLLITGCVGLRAAIESVADLAGVWNAAYLKSFTKGKNGVWIGRRLVVILRAACGRAAACEPRADRQDGAPAPVKSKVRGRRKQIVPITDKFKRFANLQDEFTRLELAAVNFCV